MIDKESLICKYIMHSGFEILMTVMCRKPEVTFSTVEFRVISSSRAVEK